MSTPQYCLEIASLLKESDPDWSKLFRWFAGQYELDQNETLTRIRHQYGGMGSFSDLVLYRDGKVDFAGMEKLDELRNSLYEQLATEIIQLRNR